MPSLDISKSVVVDGSNLATEGRTLPSYAQLKAALADFASEFPKSKLTIIVDATFEHRIDPSEAKEFEKAEAAGKIITPPAGAIGRGDAFVLRIADKTDATVLSNDSFQEFHGEYDWLFTEGRLIGGKPVPGIGWVFTLRTPVRGPKSRVAVAVANKKRRKNEASELGYASLEEEVAARRAAGSKGPANKPVAKKAVAASAPSSDESPSSRRRRRSGQVVTRPVNDVVPFLEFVGKHKVGSKIACEIDSFASHGCYVVVDGVRCYLPLVNMGSPAPRSPREAVKRGQALSLEVIGFQAGRRSVELSLPGALAVAARKRFGAASSKAQTDSQADTKSAATNSDPTSAAAKKSAGRKVVAKKAAAPVKPVKPARLTAKKAAAPVKAVAQKADKPVKPVKPETKKPVSTKSVAKKSAATKSVAKKAAPAKASPAAKSVVPAKPATPADKPVKPVKPAAKKIAAPVKKSSTNKSVAKKPVAKKSATKPSGRGTTR